MQHRSQGFTLVELLVVIGIVGTLLAITLVAINPARQFKQANNAKRTADVNAILNAVTQLKVDSKGTLASPIVIPATLTNFAGSDAGLLALCNAIMPTYIAALPTDPTAAGVTFTGCNAAFNLGYSIMTGTGGRVTVSAPSAEAPDGGTPPVISVSR